MRRASRTGLLALALAALALTACGGDGDGGGDKAAGGREKDKRVDVRGVGLMSGNSTAQFANCRDWRGGTKEQRYATIEDIRGQLTPQSSKTAESDLSDERAYKIFQRVCANEYASEMRLYKLYYHAQAFAPLSKDLPRRD